MRATPNGVNDIEAWTQLSPEDSSLPSSLPSQPPELQATLGPPLEFLPKDIEPAELQAYRTDYQAFRAGCATGARGEIGSLCPSWPSRLHLGNRGHYRRLSRRSNTTRLVPLIGLTLTDCSASRSAMSAASEHLQEQELLDLTAEELASLPRSHRTSEVHLAATNSASSGTATIDFRVAGMPSTAVTGKQGVGFLVHVLASLVCLLPCFLTPAGLWWQSLWPPASYAGAVLLVAFVQAPGLKSCLRIGVARLLSQTLRMERLVHEDCVPDWFPTLGASIYGLLACSLALARTVRSGNSTRRISLLSNTPQRHDYSCWGSETEDVADCVLVRHAACSVLISFYTCLVVMALCNRNVKGMKHVMLHKQNLLDLFPHEAPGLFSYVERSVESNKIYWRTNRRYYLQSVTMSAAWTLLFFGVYAGLLFEAKTLEAPTVFAAAAMATYSLQFMLLRHVLLRVMLHLEAVKARAAAMAYCDEEGVLPFTSAHAIYVWFCVRRNVQAQNEVEYQHSTPIFAASVCSAAALSLWVGLQVSRRGLSVFALTSQGGASLMAVASACFSCLFVAVFLGTLMDIVRMEEAHIRQLRVALLRLEHARGYHLQELQEPEPAEELAVAAAMAEKVVGFLEQHDPKATVLGLEIGPKSFQVAYAALLSNLWYLLVWGVLIPLISSDGGSDE